MYRAFTSTLYAALTLTLVLQDPARACPGDCDNNGTVTVAELVAAVGMALGRSPLDCAHLDMDGDRILSIAELVAAVRSSMSGCPPPTPTKLPPSHTTTSTPTITPTAQATQTHTETASATATPLCTISLSPEEIQVPGCPRDGNNLEGTFELIVSDENCCWTVLPLSGTALLSPDNGCGRAQIHFSVPPNPIALPTSQQIGAYIVPAGDVDVSGISQSRSCTRTPTPARTRTPTSAN